MPTSTSTPHWSGGEGYDRMESARGEGWRAVPSWGLAGYDLGDWPYVVVYHRGATEFAVDIEGDVTAYRFESSVERDAKTDELALSYWRRAEASWIGGAASVEEPPADLRGPFSRRRLAEHEASTAASAADDHLASS